MSFLLDSVYTFQKNETLNLKPLLSNPSYPSSFVHFLFSLSRYFPSRRTPVQVLVISLVFIAFVVLMHIYGKVRSSVIKEDEE